MNWLILEKKTERLEFWHASDSYCDPHMLYGSSIWKRLDAKIATFFWSVKIQQKNIVCPVFASEILCSVRKRPDFETKKGGMKMDCLHKCGTKHILEKLNVAVNIPMSGLNPKMILYFRRDWKSLMHYKLLRRNHMLNSGEMIVKVSLWSHFFLNFEMFRHFCKLIYPPGRNPNA